MYFSVGSPKTISDLKLRPADANVARRATEIAVLDDEPFVRTEQLRTHGFLVTELGGDLKSVSQIDRYPIVVCDVRGVGKSFGSAAEGAHVVSEIRKAYPDKYLIAYTGMTYDVIVTEKLQAASVDKIMQKDAAVDAWVQLLDTAIKEVTDPKRR